MTGAVSPSVPAVGDGEASTRGERKLWVTEWSNLRTTLGHRRPCSWPELVALLRGHAGAFRGDDHHPGWSPATFDGNRRTAERVEQVFALVLDVDHTASIDAALAPWEGYRACWHTTRRHKPDAPRLRVVLALSRPLSKTEYEKAWQWARERALAAGEETDKAPKDASRYWYLPGSVDGAPVLHGELDGAVVDVDAVLDAVVGNRGRETGRPAVSRTSGLQVGEGGGTGRPGDEWAARTSWAQVLEPHGWTLTHRREDGSLWWRRPGKLDRGHSATVTSDGNILYMFSSACPPLEANQYYTKFGAYAALECGGDHREAARRLAAQGFGRAESGSSAANAQGHSVIDGAAPTAQVGGAQRGTRPIIRIDTDQPRVVEEAISALATEPSLYQRGGLLSQVVQDARPASVPRSAAPAPRIAPVQLARVRELMAQTAEWQRLVDQQWVAAHPPEWAVRAVVGREQWSGIRALDGVTEHPVIRRDGSVLDQPGYDDASGLLYLPNAKYPPVPTKPSAEQVGAAVELLAEVVADFPFATAAHRSAWFAAVVTTVVRVVIAEPCPLFLVDANARGAGKTLLADCVAQIATGRDGARMVEAEHDEETRKRITAIVLAGRRIVLIDNIAGPLGSAALDAALTGTTWSDRILGASQLVELPLLVTWLATGNNVVVRGDTSRRVVHVRLESPLEQPDMRSEFRHPRLLAWVRRKRPQLLVAVLTLLRGFFAAGRPTQGLTPWGSYEEWTRWVRDPLVWAGLPDPAETRDALQAASDIETDALRALVALWELVAPNCEAVTAAEALQRATANPQLAELLDTVAAGAVRAKAGQPLTAPDLGYVLRRAHGRNIGGRIVEQAGKSNSIHCWRVRRVTP